MSEHFDQLRAEYPDVNPVLFDVMEERQQLREELSELRETVAHLIGFYGSRAGNADLAELVGALQKAIGITEDGPR